MGEDREKLSGEDLERRDDDVEGHKLGEPGRAGSGDEAERNPADRMDDEDVEAHRLDPDVEAHRLDPNA